MSLISQCECTCLHVRIHVYLCLFVGESCRWKMRADGSPWTRHVGAGKDPAVGRALTHPGVSVARLSIKSMSLMGSEMELWFGMALYCGCCVCFCVCTSVCVIFWPSVLFWCVWLTLGLAVHIAYHVTMQQITSHVDLPICVSSIHTDHHSDVHWNHPPLNPTLPSQKHLFYIE